MSSATHYTLRASKARGARSVRISRADFETYQRAQRTLARALGIEELYEILVSNFLEFETFVLDAASQAAVRTVAPYLEQHRLRIGATVKLVNLLSAARMYVDQVPKKVRDCFSPGQEEMDRVKAEFSKEYDAHIEYRFIEAVRNYAQHYGTPVHWTQRGMGWTSLKQDGRLEYHVEIASLRSFLKQDGSFKVQVLEELPERVDLRSCVRRYLESVSKVHHYVRKLLTKPVERSRRALASAHRRFPQKNRTVDVALVAVRSSGKVRDEIPLLLAWDKMRKDLASLNRELINLHKTHVTGRLRSLDGK
jgi:hypothetical protein